MQDKPQDKTTEQDGSSDLFDFPLDKLLSFNLENLGNMAALNLIGKLIDLSGLRERPEGTGRALQLCDALTERPLSDIESVLLQYFKANAWSSQRRHRASDRETAWSWEQPELVKELYHLRSALRHTGFEKLDKVRRCQILTNTGNLFNTAGRFVEAIEYWERALTIIPNFSMALGNLGYGLLSYARTLFDRGHAVTMMKFAHDNLQRAIAPDAFFDSFYYNDVKEAMGQKAKGIAEHINLEKVTESVDLEGHSIGHSKQERAYRIWCLQYRLFLNPLNDLGPYPIASRDILTLPDLVVDVNEPPTLIGFYNQLKQEYVGARYLYYEGTRKRGPHFGDRDVLLHDTMDYPAYSLAVERTKSAFRVAYSLFDKLAFFINAYWRLEMPERSINFRSIWYSKLDRGRHGSLRECFSGYENWPLRGLFWVSKDLLEEGTELSDTVEPDATALKTIRNHLEHRYLKVHDWPWTADDYAGSQHDFLRDSLAYSLTRGDLEIKALRLLKLARAGLIYLSLAVHQEERLRAARRGNGLVVPMELGSWPDEWKR